MIVNSPSTVNPAARPWQLRALAALFVVLYVLSAVRGLVPGLCLNLRAAESYAAVFDTGACTLERAESCCASVSGDKGAADSTPKSPERCPFCRLALGLTETPQFVYFTPLAAEAFQPFIAPPSRAATKPVNRLRAGRSPPFGLFV